MANEGCCDSLSLDQFRCPDQLYKGVEDCIKLNYEECSCKLNIELVISLVDCSHLFHLFDIATKRRFLFVEVDN